jgi:hypothetical protein
MFSVGMDIVDNYRKAEKCIRNVSALYVRFQSIVEDLTSTAASVDVYELYIESTLALGNISWTYKGCYISTESSILQAYYHILQYRSLSNYFINLLPNMLSYAFVMNQWIKKMQSLQQQSNYTGLAYYYGMIVRNVFFFDIPESSGFNESIQKHTLLTMSQGGQMDENSIR